jgi:hypothetical protein
MWTNLKFTSKQILHTVTVKNNTWKRKKKKSMSLVKVSLGIFPHTGGREEG